MAKPESAPESPVNRTPGRRVTLSGYLTGVQQSIVGNGDPDAYLRREARPTFRQKISRTLAVLFNRPDRLS